VTLTMNPPHARACERVSLSRCDGDPSILLQPRYYAVLADAGTARGATATWALAGSADVSRSWNGSGCWFDHFTHKSKFTDAAQVRARQNRMALDSAVRNGRLIRCTHGSDGIATLHALSITLLLTTTEQRPDPFPSASPVRCRFPVAIEPIRIARALRASPSKFRNLAARPIDVALCARNGGRRVETAAQACCVTRASCWTCCSWTSPGVR
jgi:hypothetical protein